jgi:hypothetical protein
MITIYKTNGNTNLYNNFESGAPYMRQGLSVGGEDGQVRKSISIITSWTLSDYALLQRYRTGFCFVPVE